MLRRPAIASSWNGQLQSLCGPYRSPTATRTLFSRLYGAHLAGPSVRSRTELSAEPPAGPSRAICPHSPSGWGSRGGRHGWRPDWVPARRRIGSARNQTRAEMEWWVRAAKSFGRTGREGARANLGAAAAGRRRRRAAAGGEEPAGGEASETRRRRRAPSPPRARHRADSRQAARGAMPAPVPLPALPRNPGPPWPWPPALPQRPRRPRGPTDLRRWSE